MPSILTFSILFLFVSCSKRSDIVFSAYDELHSLTLYEHNKNFEMIYNGFNTVEGNYYFKNDTIFLTYATDEVLGPNPEKRANKILARAIAVDKKKNRISSLSGMQFCGEIRVNLLQ
jgi:hypothetical protein